MGIKGDYIIFLRTFITDKWGQREI